jgi:hypothetical protein
MRIGGMQKNVKMVNGVNKNLRAASTRCWQLYKVGWAGKPNIPASQDRIPHFFTVGCWADKALAQPTRCEHTLLAVVQSRLGWKAQHLAIARPDSSFFYRRMLGW